MNIQKLQTLIPILQKTDQSEFCMGSVTGWNHEENKHRYCILGLLYREHHPDVEHINFRVAVDYLHKYFETGKDNQRYAWDNLSFFIFGGQWSMRPELNTIEHAVHRINLILSGYEPKGIWEEVNGECARLNLQPIERIFLKHQP